MCCIFKAKLLYIYCKVSDQYDLSAIVFRGSTRPFLYVFDPGQCFIVSNSTYCPPVKTVLGLILAVLWQWYSWGEHLPFPLSEGLHMISSAEGSLSWRMSIPTVNPACGRCMKPEIILTYGSFYVTGSQSLTCGRLWVSCPSCSQQIPLTLLSLCFTFFLVLQPPVLPFLLRALACGHGWSKNHSGS